MVFNATFNNILAIS